MRAPLLLVSFGALVLLLQRSANDSPSDDARAYEYPTVSDDFSAVVSETWNRIMGTPASQMTISPEFRAVLAAREALRLDRYELGDGGWTIGRGHFTPYSSPPPPLRITREEAEALFDRDLEERAMRWVRAYVTAPLTQSQFDALTSMAFNLSPRSFRTIADAVNRGDDPEAAAMRFIRAGTNLERGLRNRREEELAWYRREGIADNMG